MKTPTKILLGGITALGFVPFLMGQMKLTPSGEMFALACENIKVEKEELLKRKFHFRINADKMAIRGPFTDERKRRLDKKYLLDVGAYLEYLNDRLLNKQGHVFTVHEVTIETGWGGVGAKNAPVFNIRMSGVDALDKKVEVEKAAMGPAYGMFEVHNVVRNPIAIRSANIACLAAFLRTMLALEEHFETASPITALAPSAPMNNFDSAADGISLGQRGNYGGTVPRGALR